MALVSTEQAIVAHMIVARFEVRDVIFCEGSGGSVVAGRLAEAGHRLYFVFAVTNPTINNCYKKWHCVILTMCKPLN